MISEIVYPGGTSDLDANYELGAILGKGAFGVVRLATERRTNETYACKSISKARLLTPADVADCRKEIEILHLLSPHKTIADLKTVYEDRDHVHIIMEYCAGGELFDRIVKKGSFSERDAARFFRQMVEMVGHCHSCNVMHRDIKPENFLLSDESDDANLLACDFGLGAFFRPGQFLSTLVGSPFYVAPEVLRRRYGPEADVWSLGVVLYILLSGVPPFWGRTDKDIFIAILKGTFDMESSSWENISDAAKDLLGNLLTVDPKERPSVPEMLSHPWLKEQGMASEVPLHPIVITRMKTFAASTKLRKAAILAAAQHLSHEEIRGLKELFKSYDANGDGIITFEELRTGLQASCGSSSFDAEELRLVMEDTDVDNSGGIDYKEFLAATVNTALLEREDILRKLFRELDVDGNGTLTVEEIEGALKKMPLGAVDTAEVLELVHRADVNGDGVVDFEEFVAEWRNSNSGEAAAHAAKMLKRGLPSGAESMEIDYFFE